MYAKLIDTRTTKWELMRYGLCESSGDQPGGNGECRNTGEYPKNYMEIYSEESLLEKDPKDLISQRRR